MLQDRIAQGDPVHNQLALFLEKLATDIDEYTSRFCRLVSETTVAPIHLGILENCLATMRSIKESIECTVSLEVHTDLEPAQLRLATVCNEFEATAARYADRNNW